VRTARISLSREEARPKPAFAAALAGLAGEQSEAATVDEIAVGGRDEEEFEARDRRATTGGNHRGTGRRKEQPSKRLATRRA
jgi:hypothetical protein